jgi:hypothetical protein
VEDIQIGDIFEVSFFSVNVRNEKILIYTRVEVLIDIANGNFHARWLSDTYISHSMWKYEDNSKVDVWGEFVEEYEEYTFNRIGNVKTHPEYFI